MPKANRTFRLDIPAIRLLEQEAKEKGLSTNTIVNRLILRNLRRERELRTSRTFSVTAQTLRLLTEELSDEKIIEIGKKLAKDDIRQSFYKEVFGEMTPDAIIDAMKRNHDSSESEHGKRKILILALYAGRKWALLEGIVYQTLLASAGLETKFSVDENSVIFEYEVKPVAT